MSAVKFEFEDAIKEGQTFGEWVVENFIWAGNSLAMPLPDIEVADKLLDQEKQAVYEFILAGKKADEELEINFPEPSGLIDKLLKQEGSEQVKVQDVDKASAEGLTAGQNPESDLLDNPYVKFNKPLWRTWRQYFIKGRKGPEPAPEKPAEPTLTPLQRNMLQIDAELVALNPRVKAAQNLVDTLKDDLKEAKSDLDDLLEEQADLCNKLSVISEGGAFQQGLPFDDDTPHPDVEAGKDRPHGTPLMDATAKVLREDPAKTAKIEVLGMTESETDKLIAAEIETVAELESRIRTDEWWHKKVPGFGPKKVDKLIDLLTDWRMKNPVPDPEDDEPEEVEATAEEADEADTVPFAKDLQWWCSECKHEWPVDGDNAQCPECENETGNYQFGEFSCPDANAAGVIFRNFEEVKIIDEEKVKCLLQVYEVPDGGWISAVVIEDKQTPYMFSNSMNIEDYTSTSRDAAIWNQLNRVITNEDSPQHIIEGAEAYSNLHLSHMNVDYFDCANCEAEYCFDEDNVD